MYTIYYIFDPYLVLYKNILKMLKMDPEPNIKAKNINF